MCHRLSFVTSSEKVRQDLGVTPDGTLRTSYNIGPTQHAYIVTNNNTRQLDYVTWGLIPYWSNTGTNEGKLIHARAEGIETSSSFRIPIRSRRCLVVIDSFYSLLPGKTNIEKEAYRFYMNDGSLMVLAGLWDSWYKDEYEVKSFAIIMIPETDVWPWRMPVILDTQEKRNNWLADESLDLILDQLAPPKKEKLIYYKVSEQLLQSQEDNFELHVKID
ncbi:MAG TPA: SOS response-associated peptidase [Saprospiraceae bacterium]|nr:SOS response-associated peptidase [Saprospiraceae bacterium]